MVIIKPFKATVLNPKLEGRTQLICPVYDTIDAARYDKYAVVKNNVIHFTTRREGVTAEDFVDYAKMSLERFYKDGILIECEEPAFYIYGIRYRLSDELMEQIPEEERRAIYFAFGLIALVKVEKLNEQHIAGHEKTFETNTMERYYLMKECGMNFSPVVAEYNMPDHDMNSIFEQYLGFHRPDLKINANRKPIVDVVLNGCRHLLWAVSDNEIMDKIQHLMRDRSVMILDGHHRYTASYRLSNDGGTAYTLMMLVEGGDSALLLLPWHRCVRECRIEELWDKIAANFTVERCDRCDVYAKLNERSGDFDVMLCMYDGEKFYLLQAEEQRIRCLARERGEQVGLDVISLHEWLIDPTLIGKPERSIAFTASPSDAIEKVDTGSYQVAFFLRPLRITDVEYKARVEKKGFPQKSTLFLPKVAEGVVLRRFGEE